MQSKGSSIYFGVRLSSAYIVRTISHDIVYRKPERIGAVRVYRLSGDRSKRIDVRGKTVQVSGFSGYDRTGWSSAGPGAPWRPSRASRTRTRGREGPPDRPTHTVRAQDRSPEDRERSRPRPPPPRTRSPPGSRGAGPEENFDFYGEIYPKGQGGARRRHSSSPPRGRAASGPPRRRAAARGTQFGIRV